MSFESDLFDNLKTIATTYPLIAPQGATTPYIIYRKASADRQYSHDGYSNLMQDRVTIHYYSTGKNGARLGIKQVQTAMDGWGDVQASLRDTRTGGYIKHDWLPFNKRTMGAKLFWESIDYVIWHEG